MGLGNPGARYVGTRHNVGFRVLECLAARHDGVWQPDASLAGELCRVRIGARDCALLRPLTFMNRSGESVAAARRRWPTLDPTQALVVVYDDLDLPLGRIRLRPSGGAGGHRGMSDVLDVLEDRAIARVRFGIGRPASGEPVLDWVLGRFAAEDEDSVVPEALERAARALEAIVADGMTAAMGRFNASD